jgi:titin
MTIAGQTFTVTQDASTGGTVPLAPCCLTAKSVTSTSVLLQWGKNELDFTGYKVERLNNSVKGATWTLIANIPTTSSNGSYTDTNVVRGTSYSYRVKAYNSAGDSAPSTSVTVTIP